MPAILRDSQLLIGRAIGSKFLRENQTEAYVEIPPALVITASDGSTFTLGNRCRQYGWVMEFNVTCNDIDTGEFAHRVVYRDHKVRIFGRDGWRVWTGKSFI